jgi:hypothetical protein
VSDGGACISLENRRRASTTKPRETHAHLLSRTSLLLLNLMSQIRNTKLAMDSLFHPTLLHSLRTHYRGQVLTVSLNQGLNYLPEVPVATKRRGNVTKHAQPCPSPGWGSATAQILHSRIRADGRRCMILRDCGVALPTHALSWSGVDGLSQPGAERFCPRYP